MDPFLKKNISIAAVILLLVVAYVGNFLPLRKSLNFIDANRKLNQEGQVKTLDQLIALLSHPLDLYSPIGQQELVRNTTNIVFDLVKGENGKNPPVVKALMEMVDTYYSPLVAKPRGMSFNQDLYVLGLTNEAAAIQTRDVNYASKAQEVYERGLTLSPKRPQFLYGLLDVFRMKSDFQNAKRIAEEILTYWPDDQRTQRLLAQIDSKLAAPSTAPTR